jgi:hypothetical protein
MEESVKARSKREEDEDEDTRMKEWPRGGQMLGSGRGEKWEKGKGGSKPWVRGVPPKLQQGVLETKWGREVAGKEWRAAHTSEGIGGN